MEQKKMTEREKADITLKAFALQDEGKRDEADKLLKTIPVPPFLAKIGKDVYGADFLVNGGYNLSEAEAEYGEGWLAS